MKMKNSLRMLNGSARVDGISTLLEAEPADAQCTQEKARKPDWLKRTVPGGDNYTRIKGKLRELKLVRSAATGASNR